MTKLEATQATTVGYGGSGTKETKFDTETEALKHRIVPR